MSDLVKRLREGEPCGGVCGRHFLPHKTCTCGEAAARIGELEAALSRCMIGGNHLAVWLPEPCPPVETEPLDALEQIGAGAKYDMWCCWRAIMQARAALGITSAE